LYLKDNAGFEKMILSYDTFNPDGSLTCQLIIITPIISPESWEVSYVNELETRFNENVQSTGELVEII